jgi:hypothetical protein
MGGERKVYRVLVGKPEGKRPLGIPRHRWEDGIRMVLREIGLGGVDRIRLAQDRDRTRMDLGKIGCESVEWSQLAQDRDRWCAVINAVMNLWVLAPRS